jgi:hypothetical protein
LIGYYVLTRHKQDLGMPNTAVEPLPAGSGQDPPIVIAAMPISVRQRRIALAVIIVLAIIDVIVVPVRERKASPC